MTTPLPLVADTPQATLAGLPVETRALTRAAVRLRAFNTEDRRILVPRLMGAGWTVNFGAVATRLGLLRPEDSVADLAAHIPESVRIALRTLPWALTGTTAILAATGARTASRLPTNWDWRFRPTATAPAVVALGIPTALALGAAIWSSLPDDAATFDPLRPALASGTAALGLGICASSLASHHNGNRPLPAVAPAILAGPILTGVLTVVALRAGRAHLQRTLTAADTASAPALTDS